MVLNCVHDLVAQLIHTEFLGQKEEVAEAIVILLLLLVGSAPLWRFRKDIPIDVIDKVAESCRMVFGTIHFAVGFLESTIECFGEVIRLITKELLMDLENLSLWADENGDNFSSKGPESCVSTPYAIDELYASCNPGIQRHAISDSA
jgi:hypothetical protein